MNSRFRPGPLTVWIGVIWLLALTALSLKLWGVVLVSTHWLYWLKAASQALLALFTLGQTLLEILWAGAVLAAAVLAGRSLLIRVLPEKPPLSLCAAAGLVLLALAAEALGSIGLYYSPWLIGAVSLALMACLVDLLIDRRKGRSGLPAGMSLRLPEAAALLFFGGVVLISAVNPTLFYDALYYHLSLPKYYLYVGSTEPVVWHPLSCFPSNAEMLLGLALAGGSGISAQALMGGVWICAVLMIRQTGARFVSAEAGPWVLLVALCTLSFALSALMVTADPLVLLFSMGGLYCICGADHAAGRGDARAFTNWILGWAVMAGGAAGVKYTTWITVFAFQSVLVLLLSLRVPGGVWRALVALAAAALVLLPWPLRNLVSSGNPVMPVPVGDLFTGLPAPAWEALRQDAHQVRWSLETLPGNLLTPWTMVFDRWDSLAMKWGAARFIGPMIWMGAPLLLIFRRKFSFPALIAGYGLSATLLSIWMMGMIRFAFPGLGALAVVAGFGLFAVFSRSRGHLAARTAFLFVVSVSVLLCAALFMRASFNLTKAYSFPRLKGDLSAYMEYRAGINPFETGSIPVQLEANELTPEDSVFLFVGEARSFYLDRQACAPPFLSPNPLLEILRRRPPESAASALRAAGFTHVLVSFPELDRLNRQYGVLGADPRTVESLKEFVRGPWCSPIIEDESAVAVVCALEGKD